MLFLLALPACHRDSRADRIVGDRTLFNEHHPEALEFMREECPDFARSVGAQSPGLGAAVSRTALSAHVPEGYRPALERITQRYGDPDSTVGDTHYYDDIGLRADSAGIVFEIMVPCSAATDSP